MLRTILFGGFLLVLFTAVMIPKSQAVHQPDDADWRAKVAPLVLAETEPDRTSEPEALPETDFLVVLAEQGDVSAAASLPTKEEKGQFVYETLTAVAQRTQPPIMQQLDAQDVSYNRFWLVNMIAVRGDIELVEAMARRDDVAAIRANPTVAMQLVPTTEAQMRQALRAVSAIEWNIALVDAPDVWQAGITGEGIVIGGQDTGYDWNHPGLINSYRGWDGTTAVHDYNWHDAIHSGGGICGADSAEPCDDHGHGTHTMGTMVGNDMPPTNPAWPAGANNAVGMAPGAKWIGCRNMNVGNGTPASYTECYEFFVAPYPLGGDPMTDGDPGKAPHVINNSWSCPATEGCDADDLLAPVQNVVAAGIVTVHAAGNLTGAGCGTVNVPAATYDESFSVGATTSTDSITTFSRRGPSSFDNGLKPDISAPGQGVRSTTVNGNYGSSSGTSMAAPHVAGLVALLLSARPDLAGQVDQIESIIQNTAVPLTTSEGCGGDGPLDVPNHTYGYGRIDAATAVGSVMTPTLTIQKEAPAAVTAGDNITYTLTVQYHHPISLTNNVVLTDVIPLNSQFITATLPHTFDGTTIQWEQAAMTENSIWEVQLVVGTILSETAPIENNNYGVKSDELPYVAGVPVVTAIWGENLYYLPYIRRD